MKIFILIASFSVLFSTGAWAQDRERGFLGIGIGGMGEPLPMFVDKEKHLKDHKLLADTKDRLEKLRTERLTEITLLLMLSPVIPVAVATETAVELLAPEQKSHLKTLNDQIASAEKLQAGLERKLGLDHIARKNGSPYIDSFSVQLIEFINRSDNTEIKKVADQLLKDPCFNATLATFVEPPSPMRSKGGKKSEESIHCKDLASVRLFDHQNTGGSIEMMLRIRPANGSK